eukprot:432967_1
MGISRDIYHNGKLDDWQTWTLTILNITTFILTICNLIYLRRNMPKAHTPQINQHNKPLLHELPSASLPPLRRQKSIESIYLSQWRNKVIYFFYIMPLIPMLLAFASHYGAQYPEQSIWIFPALDIIVVFAFLSFMKMIILSCDGMHVLRFYLEPLEDTSAKCKCGKKSNAYIGFKKRFKFAYLIIIKPIVDYTFSYFEYFYGNTNFENTFRYTLKLLIIICTCFPATGIKMFHHSCYKYSRMKRTNIKTNFIVYLAPGVQLQQLLISFLFNINIIPGFDNVKQKFRWCCLYGMIMCFEMVIFASMVSFFVFNPNDLMLWDDTDILLHGEQICQIDSIATTTINTKINIETPTKTNKSQPQLVNS